MDNLLIASQRTSPTEWTEQLHWWFSSRVMRNNSSIYLFIGDVSVALSRFRSVPVFTWTIVDLSIGMPLAEQRIEPMQLHYAFITFSARVFPLCRASRVERNRYYSKCQFIQLRSYEETNKNENWTNQRARKEAFRCARFSSTEKTLWRSPLISEHKRAFVSYRNRMGENISTHSRVESNRRISLCCSFGWRMTDNGRNIVWE